VSAAKFFLRRLAPIGGMPRTLVVGVLVGYDSITTGQDDQCADLGAVEAHAIAAYLRCSDRGEATIDGATTIGMSTHVVMMGLGRLAIKEQP
jgi:hypothetical protein